MAVGSGSGFYTLTPSLGAQCHSLSHGPLMILMPGVPVALGVKRQDGGTVHYPHKLQTPKEKNKQNIIGLIQSQDKEKRKGREMFV